MARFSPLMAFARIVGNAPRSRWLLQRYAACRLLGLVVCGACLAHPAVAQGTGGGITNGPSIVVDSRTQGVLFADRPDQRWHPASLTKLMTAYIAFEEVRAGRMTMESKVKQSAVSIGEPPSKIGYPVGTQITLKTAIRALIIKSANDVAVMIAEGVSGTRERFVERMNATAARLGMSRTVFRNPNGLPNDAQVTTARDMARLAVAVIRDFDEHAEFFTERRMRVGQRVLRSFNRLLTDYAGADGLKTGFICASGFNIVSSATRDGRRLIAVVMGAPSAKWRNGRAMRLLDYGFQVAPWRSIFGAPSLSSMALDPAANPAPVNYAPYVTAWSCGHRAGRRAANRQAATPSTNEVTPATAGARRIAPRSASAFNRDR